MKQSAEYSHNQEVSMKVNDDKHGTLFGKGSIDVSVTFYFVYLLWTHAQRASMLYFTDVFLSFL